MVVVQPARRLAEPAADPIPLDGASHAWNRESEARLVTSVGSGLDTDRTGPSNAPPRAHGGKAPMASQPAAARQRGPVGVRCFRPLRRRALSTLRPPGVDIRIRKPWVLRRYAFLG